jgi:GNAT superfamily N-acetyltransferase
MSENTTESPALNSSEAILAIADVPASVKFYREVLGFEREWLWGDPPTFGGVRWGKVHVMLCLQPALARAVEGHQHAFFCEDINSLRERHRVTGAPIISEIENKPWGIREYTVRDINGYHLRFGGPQTYERPEAARSTMPDFIRIIERLPSVEEFGVLTDAVGWNRNDETMVFALRNSLYGVVAMDTRERGNERIVGAVRVVGDGARFFYVQDVMVLPEFQHQCIGSAMMEAVMGWLKRAAPKGAFIGLFTGEPAFYERYGFQTGHGMSLCL